MAVEIDRVGVVGAGVIGASWTSLFLAAGLEVDVYDPAEDAERRVREYVARAWPTLEQLGFSATGNPDAVTFHSTVDASLRDIDFVQESVPERPAIKHAAYAGIEEHLAPRAIVATSTSGIMLSELQKGWRNPSRFLLGHPFNPPHLIPLVELYANERTDGDVLGTAEAFYESIGKQTIRLKREIPGHVANRLQSQLWREAVYLIAQDIVSVEDLDKAIWAGPGLRLAAMGPHMLYHLNARGGIREFCEVFGPPLEKRWEVPSDVSLTQEVIDALAGGIEEEAGGRSVAELSAERDRMVVSILKALGR